jgi:hypothetical protein
MKWLLVNDYSLFVVNAWHHLAVNIALTRKSMINDNNYQVTGNHYQLNEQQPSTNE